MQENKPWLRYMAAMAMQVELSDAQRKAVEDVELLDEMDAPVAQREVLGCVDPARRALYAARFEADVAEGDLLVGVRCEASTQEKFEHVVRVRGEEAEPLIASCKVSWADLPPTAYVEYVYPDAPDAWRVSLVSLPCLETYRKSKFKDWEARMLNPQKCRAEFRSMFAIGPVFTVYDHLMFPHADAEDAARFVVKDDKGKDVIVPRPVGRLRVWRTATQSYEEVEATLEGSPAPADRDAYWKELCERIKTAYGDELWAEMTSKKIGEAPGLAADAAAGAGAGAAAE